MVLSYKLALTRRCLTPISCMMKPYYRSTQDIAKMMLSYDQVVTTRLLQRYCFLIMYHDSGSNSLSFITWPAGSQCACSVCVLCVFWCHPEAAPRYWFDAAVVIDAMHQWATETKTLLKVKFSKLSYRIHFDLVFHKNLHWINFPKHVYLWNEYLVSFVHLWYWHELLMGQMLEASDQKVYHHLKEENT